MDVADWLRGLGLEQYAPAFVQNHISWDLLADLSGDDLRELGIASLGHRRRLLAAIAVLRAGNTAIGTAAAPVRDEQATSAAERRQVTVMFCDLVGSTELASRLDPEDLRDVIGRYHASVAETVARFDGFVAKYMGDGVLIYFGYPDAHEDDPEQAVRAGLAIVDAVGELPLTQPSPDGRGLLLPLPLGEGRGEGRLQVRIGIATGLVVVGDLIGAGSAQEQAIVGETPNLAARLQALAQPNAIIVAESTCRQIGALFEVADLGRQTLKGFAEPQRAWRVLSENRALGRFEALRSGATPLVGRDEELELLLRRWARAKAGSGRVVLISGEAGVGKSRLAEALAERIADEPHIRLRYFCSSHHQDSALHPLIAQMERAAGFARADAPATKLAKLQTLLAPTTPPVEDVALIAELHSLPSAGIAPPLDVTPQKKKEKTFEALLHQIERLARQQPVLMVFEDIHWIDPSSRELIDRTIEQIAPWPVLLLATFRPEFQPPWTGQPHVTTLNLARLDRRETTAMIENLAGSALPDAVLEEIAERTDGVPLFVEELTKAVLESGPQGTAALSAIPHPGLSVPATLHASLMARLDRLGAAAKDIAQKGAVIGREFSYELLASIADLTEIQLQDGLDRLTNSGLLFARGAAPQATYIFKHALVQDAAYGTLLRSRRQNLHQRIGTALEQRFPDIARTQPELLAHHFTEAGLAERAVEYWSKAGRQAVARSAMVEAEALLHKGLALLRSLPDGVWRQEHELDLQIALGQALIAVRGYGRPEVGEAFVRARQLCAQLGSPRKLLPVLFGQWVHHAVGGDLEHAQQFAAELRQLAETQKDVVTHIIACRASGFTCLSLGEFAAARAYLERALALYDPQLPLLYAELEPHGTLVLILMFLSLMLVCSGCVGQARRRCDEGLAEARERSHAHTLSLAYAFAWWTGWSARSDPMELLRYADELLALSNEHGFASWHALALMDRGWCLAALGRADDGIPLITTGITEVHDTGSDWGVPIYLTMLADAYRMAGQPQVALVHLAEAQRLAEETQERWVGAETRRLRGDVLLCTGDLAAAEANYREAIALAQRQGARLFELRAATSLALLRRDQGSHAEARELLAPVYAWFTEGFDAPDLVEAKALLEELNARWDFVWPESWMVRQLRHARA